MTKTEQETLEIRESLFELIGEVTAKCLFASYGLFSKNVMFAIYQNKMLYVRAEGELAERLKSEGAISYMSHLSSVKLTISNYYYLPPEITSSKEKYKQILESSIAQVQTQKNAEQEKKYRRIKDLPNLSMKYERLLAKVGIEELSLLRSLGAANAYTRLVKQGMEVEISVFWSLVAALQNKHASLLTAKERENALKLLNLAFENAGLKPIKLS